MVIQKIICDCCGIEMEESVYFITASLTVLTVTLSEADVPSEGIIRHVCGAECATKLVSGWLNTRKRETNGNHDTARSGK